MASLGTFTAAAREYDPDAGVRDTFEFCGQTFTVFSEIPAMLELTITAALAGQAGGMEGDAAMWAALKTALSVPAHEVKGRKVPPDESQWEQFHKLAVDNSADSELLSAIALNIVGAQVGRPTGRRSISSDGPPPTSTSSNSPASVNPVSPD